MSRCEAVWRFDLIVTDLLTKVRGFIETMIAEALERFPARASLQHRPSARS
jgi:hypothetical protein